MKTKKLLLISGILASTMGILSSCNDGKDKKESTSSSKESGKQNEDELQSFMLGGIYFENGYGGKEKTEEFASQSGTSDDALIEGYKGLFIFPFKPAEGADIKQMLKEYWDIDSKDSLLNVLDKLKNHKMESSHTKSWDYARFVNNACMGYAAGYLTKDETTKLVGEILPLAKADYKTWDEYFADFANGRDKWNAEETADKKSLDELAANITKGNKSIYSILPLH